MSVDSVLWRGSHLIYDGKDHIHPRGNSHTTKSLPLAHTLFFIPLFFSVPWALGWGWGGEWLFSPIRGWALVCPDTVTATYSQQSDWLWVPAAATTHFEKCLRPWLTSAIIYRHKYRCWEGNLTGRLRPLNTTSVAQIASNYAVFASSNSNTHFPPFQSNQIDPPPQMSHSLPGQDLRGSFLSC